MGRTEYNLERNTSRYFSKALHSKFTCVKSSPTRGIRNKGLAYTLHPAARAPWIVAAQTQLRLKPPPFPNLKRRGARSEQNAVRIHLHMLWRVDMPLKPSANSDTRRDATNLNTRRTRTPGPTAINLNRAKSPPPILSYHMPVIPFYIHLLHTQPDLLEKSQGTAEIKFRECLKKRGQSSLDISIPLSVCGPGIMISSS